MPSKALVMLIILCCFGFASGGSPVVLDAIDSGFINEVGRTSKNDGILGGAPPATFNYSMGAIDETPFFGSMIDVPRKNFFTFDLSGITPGSVTGAGLLLFNPIDGYTSPDPTETLAIGGTMTDASGMADLAADLTMVYDIDEPSDLAAAMTLYTEVADSLMGGPAFATKTVSDADEGADVEIPFEAGGVDYVNAFAGGPIVFGSELTTFDAGDFGDEVIFGFSSPLYPDFFAPDPDPIIPIVTPTPKLVLFLIPEPGRTYWALLVSVLVAQSLRRR